MARTWRSGMAKDGRRCTGIMQRAMDAGVSCSCSLITARMRTHGRIVALRCMRQHTGDHSKLWRCKGGSRASLETSPTQRTLSLPHPAPFLDLDHDLQVSAAPGLFGRRHKSASPQKTIRHTDPSTANGRSTFRLRITFTPFKI
jgi:hypothetical protein